MKVFQRATPQKTVWTIYLNSPESKTTRLQVYHFDNDDRIVSRWSKHCLFHGL